VKTDPLELKLLEESLALANSPGPAVTAAPTTVKTGSLALTAHVMDGLLSPLLAGIGSAEGSTVEFVAYKDGESAYRVLATGTVQGNTATGSWQPTAADNGTYHVTALLYDSPLGHAFPYAWTSGGDSPKVSTTDVVVAIDSEDSNPEDGNPEDSNPDDAGPVDFVLVLGSPNIYHFPDFWTTPLFNSTRIEVRGTSVSARTESHVVIPSDVALFGPDEAIATLSMKGSYDPQTGRMSGTYSWEATWQENRYFGTRGHEWDRGTFWAEDPWLMRQDLPTSVTVHFDGTYCRDRFGQCGFTFIGEPQWDDTISTDVVGSHYTVLFTAEDAP
jgi:hypothetical protein